MLTLQRSAYLSSEKTFEVCHTRVKQLLKDYNILRLAPLKRCCVNRVHRSRRLVRPAREAFTERPRVELIAMAPCERSIRGGSCCCCWHLRRRGVPRRICSSDVSERRPACRVNSPNIRLLGE